MYGTIMRGKVKAGQRDAYLKALHEQVPSADDYGHGFHSVELALEDKDPDRFVGIIHFKDKDSYVANAQRSETDAAYRQQLEFLDGEPEWIDVNYVDHVGASVGDGATAGYGTIMRGKVKAGRKAEYEQMMRGMAPPPESGFQSADVAWEDKDPDRFLVVVHFKDKDSYVANAQRSETDAAYRQQLEFLDGEPEWIDVNYVDYIGRPVGEGAAGGV